MNDKTLTALEQSIEKWERNAVAETPDDFVIGIKNCPLCVQFWSSGGCGDCPVMGSTGEDYCVGSPYGHAEHALEEWSIASSDTELRDDAHAAARAEVVFLRSLLPKS